MGDIADRLATEPSGFGAEQLAVWPRCRRWRSTSPLCSYGVGGSDIERRLRLEYSMAHRMLTGHDFIEGVRALLIDKDKRPQWRYKDLDSVPADEIEDCMAPLAAGDLALDWVGTWTGHENLAGGPNATIGFMALATWAFPWREFDQGRVIRSWDSMSARRPWRR